MSLFLTENAFRVLLADANATRSEILEAYQLLRARARVGGSQSYQDPLIFLNSVERNERTLRDALNRIESPKESDSTVARDAIKKSGRVVGIPSRINLKIVRGVSDETTDFFLFKRSNGTWYIPDRTSG